MFDIAIVFLIASLLFIIVGCIPQLNLILRYGRTKRYLLTMPIRYEVLTNYTKNFFKLEFQLKDIMEASGSEWIDEVCDDIEIIFTEDLKDYEGNELNGKADIINNFFGLNQIRVIYINTTVIFNKKLSPRSIADIFVHEYKHHYLHFKGNDWDIKHTHDIWK